MKTKLKAGDLVRVPGRTVSFRCYQHSLPQGAVAEVVEYWADGDVQVKHPGDTYSQLVHHSMLKLAKQVMRKRDAYANRRG